VYVSESFGELFNRYIETVLEARDVVFAGSVLALLRQFLKVCYDFASSLVLTGYSSDWVPDFIVSGLGLELEEDNVSDHGSRDIYSGVGRFAIGGNRRNLLYLSESRTETRVGGPHSGRPKASRTIAVRLRVKFSIFYVSTS
jgi:hypothetical protein